MNQASSQVPSEDNRFQLVNNVAKRAKILINHDTSAQLSNHRAINEAMQQEEPVVSVARAVSS
ncbi:MAG: hypothetical protein CVV27_08055 [Candidatus Melainabacteria bacterium HGW-Melainabacteria-1]|nr:MAG: hypothetical protein CVV27_08055 [Candidatus Melainabacteria bacterium HGW-Melainabacteria-1]